MNTELAAQQCANETITGIQSESSLDNMVIWNKVSQTDPSYTKRFSSGGYSGTAIDPTYQQKMATGVFGPMGKGWGLRDLNYQTVVMDDNTTLMFLYAEFWYVLDDISYGFPISSGIKLKYRTSGSNGYIKYDEEAPKKLRTNCISKSLAGLGFSADIFLGKFDDSSYIETVKQLADEQPIDGAELGFLKGMFEQTGMNADTFNNYFEIESIEFLPRGRYLEAKQMLQGNLPMTDDELAKLKELIDEAQPDEEAMLSHFGVSDICQIKQGQYADVISLLQRKINAKQKAGAK